jgi:hypothetical protein
VTPRPLIFISAVSRELHNARQLFANTLTFLGYQPVWQDIFGTEGGDLRRGFARKSITAKVFLQLVGQYCGVACNRTRTFTTRSRPATRWRPACLSCATALCGCANFTVLDIARDHRLFV